MARSPHTRSTARTSPSSAASPVAAQSGSAASGGVSRATAAKMLLSNACMGLGIVLLSAFALLEWNGLATHALIPASAALAVGVSAVLDRLVPDAVEEQN